MSEDNEITKKYIDKQIVSLIKRLASHRMPEYRDIVRKDLDYYYKIRDKHFGCFWCGKIKPWWSKIYGLLCAYIKFKGK